MQTLDGHVIIFCEYTSMCECAQESVHTLLVHEQVWSHEVSTIVLCFPVLKQGLSLNLKPEARHVDQAGCSANELLKSIHLLTPAWGLQSHLVVSHSFYSLHGCCVSFVKSFCLHRPHSRLLRYLPALLQSVSKIKNSNPFLFNYFYLTL